MKINPGLRSLLLIFIISFCACSLLRKNRQPKAEVTTLDSVSMQQILQAIRANNQKNKEIPADERPYEAASTKIWDLVHTELSVEFDYTKAQLKGLAIITLKPHAYAQDSLVLDAKGMEILDITDGDARGLNFLKYNYDGKKLTVFLRLRAQAGEQKKVTIKYIAKPNEYESKGSEAITSDKGLYFINNDRKDSTKPRQVWTQGETESNSCWFPTIDKPNQKMTQQISITLEDSNDVTLSNGVFVGRMQYKKGVYTDIWRQSIPAAPYLTMMAIGRFYVEHDKWRDKKVDYYVEPKYKPYAKLIFGKTPAMMEFFSDVLGTPYPWEKYSQVVVRDFVSGSMENVSATLHGEFLQMDAREYQDENKEDYISHELFHQWFGDLVTCESWSNLPLNESFATYGEYLWIEHSRGKMDADLHLMEDQARYLQEASIKQEPLIRFHYEDKEDMFDRHSYEKGGCVLHMLRSLLGDDIFFNGLKLYLDKNKFKSVEIHDLRLAMEEVSGQDLNWFFNQWFLSAGHPKVGIGRNYNPDTKTQNLTIDFLENTDHAVKKFKLPVAVDFYFKDSIHRENITVNKLRNSWYFQFNELPLLINVDADRVMLWEIEYNKTKEELIYQVLHAPLYKDMVEAMDQLSENNELSIEEKNTLVDFCLNHKFFGIKELGIGMLDFMRIADIEPYFDRISRLILTEKNSSLRVSALYLLNKMSKTRDIIPVLRSGTNDSSYMVMAVALDFLSEKDPATALKIAQVNESVENINVVNTIHSIYSKDTSANHAVYLVKSIMHADGYDKSIRLRETEYYIRKTKPEYSYQTILGLVQNKEKVMLDYSGEFLPDMINHFQSRRDILAYDMSRTRYTEDGYKEASQRLATYDKILELLK